MKETCTYLITKLLNLKEGEVTLTEISEEDGKITVSLKLKEKELTCPKCGSTKLYKHGRVKIRRVRHSWMMGKVIDLKILDRPRWKCTKCNKTFLEEISFLKGRSRYTKQAEQEAIVLLKGRSFSEVSKELKISYSTLRRILLSFKFEEEIKDFLMKSKELYIGIDEHSFRHQDMVLIVTELKSKRLLAILENDRLSTLERFLKLIPKERVKEFCIDMKIGYKKVIKRFFPEAKVVLDRFHLISDANRRVDEARRIEQELIKVSIPKKILLVGNERLSERSKAKLNSLIRSYPIVGFFYFVKEELRRLYLSKDRKEAEDKLNRLILIMVDNDDPEICRWGRTLREWKEEILNFFFNRTTNGYTEGCNTKAKLLKRISFGMRNVTVYINKILLAFLPPNAFHTI